MADLARMIVDEATSQEMAVGTERAVEFHVRYKGFHKRLVVLPLRSHVVFRYKNMEFRVARTDKEGCEEIVTFLVALIERELDNADEYGQPCTWLTCEHGDYVVCVKGTQLGKSIYSTHSAPGEVQQTTSAFWKILRHIV